MAARKYPSSASDEDMVHVVLSGDVSAYEVLVKRYKKPLLRYATYITKGALYAADVVQESFVKAYINLKSFNPSKKFSSWMYRIVHNEAVNRIRKESRFFSFDDMSWTDMFSLRTESLDDHIEAREIKSILRKSLQELPLTYRAPLVLFYLEDKTYDEISDVLRIPIGTVGTRINRGKKYLKKVVQKKGGGAYAKQKTKQ